MNTPKAYIIDGAPGRLAIKARATTGTTFVGASDAGLSERHPVNEDRAVIVPEKEFIAVIDGVGGEEGGAVAAQILAEQLALHPDDVPLACRTSAGYLQGEIYDRAAACVVTARVLRPSKRRRVLETFQGGDPVRLIERRRSLLQKLLQEHPFEVSKPLIRFDEERMTDVITHVVSADTWQLVREEIPVSRGDRVMLYSDGIGNNLLPAEIIRLGMESWGRRKDMWELLHRVWEVTGDRMTYRHDLRERGRVAGVCMDGYRQFPVADNRSMAIMDIA